MPFVKNRTGEVQWVPDDELQDWLDGGWVLNDGGVFGDPVQDPIDAAAAAAAAASQQAPVDTRTPTQEQIEFAGGAAIIAGRTIDEDGNPIFDQELADAQAARTTIPAGQQVYDANGNLILVIGDDGFFYVSQGDGTFDAMTEGEWIREGGRESIQGGIEGVFGVDLDGDGTFGNTFLDNLDSGGSSGSGSGSGRARPVYRNPIKEDVESQVRSLLVAMVGGTGVSEQRIKQLTDQMLKTDRFNFDNPNNEKSISETLKGSIRLYSDFQAIHELRPESIDEMNWVGSYAGQVAASGLAIGQIDQAAKELATVAATGGAVQGNVEFRQLATNQRPLGIVQRIKESASAAGRLLR